MKKTVKMWTAKAVCIAAALALAGCASSPQQKTEVLDDKGAALNIPAPAWVAAFVGDGNHAIEQLPQYKDEHCFVVEFNDKSRDFAVSWVNNASGPAQVALMISQTVLADAKNKLTGSRGDEVKAALEQMAHVMSEASFTGLRKMGDWWQIVRNKSTKVEECRAFALWTASKNSLDNQIAGNLQNIIDNNKALSQAARSIYLDLIKDIRANGFNNR
ncbi:MAG: hypothetical protein LBC77_04095 [Spirochaetaceae bacterium]|jgi:hypothetical protein|nr:hypothetical protein [Spirochaetaceae bacterium]